MRELLERLLEWKLNKKLKRAKHARKSQIWI